MRWFDFGVVASNRFRNRFTSSLQVGMNSELCDFIDAMALDKDATPIRCELHSDSVIAFAYSICIRFAFLEPIWRVTHFRAQPGNRESRSSASTSVPWRVGFVKEVVCAGCLKHLFQDGFETCCLTERQLLPDSCPCPPSPTPECLHCKERLHGEVSSMLRVPRLHFDNGFVDVL